jgi:prolyl-tRNA synthetase
VLILNSQGVPLRLEIGPNDLAKQQTLSVRRDTGAKNPVDLANIGPTVTALLDTIQSDMFSKAKATYDSSIKEITHWDDFVPALDAKNIVAIPWCEVEECEDDIKERSGRAYVPSASMLNDVLIHVSARSRKMNAPRLLEPSLFVFHSTSPAGLRSLLGRRNARLVEKTPSAGPCMGGRIS